MSGTGGAGIRGLAPDGNTYVVTTTFTVPPGTTRVCRNDR